MPRYNYKVSTIDPVGLEKISDIDLRLINSFTINSTFIPFENNVEIHIYSEEDTLIYSNPNYINHSYLQGSSTAGTVGASEITLDPIFDIQAIGYPEGGVKLVYNFLDNLYSNTKDGGEFFIEEISSDRREIRLLTNQLSQEEVVATTAAIQAKLNSTSYYDTFHINVKNNDLLIGVNIKTQTYKEYESVVIRLYEPLPKSYGIKTVLTVVTKVSDSIGFEIDAEVIPDEIVVPVLKGPNYNVDISDILSNETPYLNYNQLFSFDTANSYRELNALFNEKSVEISIDYSTYSEFIHFSSAEERLRNFKYKFDLIEDYQSKIDSFVSGQSDYSIEFYQDQINTILSNFDHYDRHLYFSSGSSSWPKTNSTKPYINATGSATGSWYSSALEDTSTFDLNNYNQLLNTVPEYLREDPRNAPYATFLHMIGQHFDNLWIYTKAITDKYDNDNRLGKGISKDLVQDALRNFGVKLYTSNKSTTDLFQTFTGELYNLTAEEFGDRLPVAALISASSNPTSQENYIKEVHKRIYHNLPLLLKAKGTERGIRALISSFGIPTDNYITGSIDSHSGLQARIFGGNSRVNTKYTGPLLSTTSSLSKIRLDDTGSIVSGDTLSQNVSIVKRDDKYTTDLHPINIGYSPTDNLEEVLGTIIPTTFNIDDYIGDPRQAYLDTYPNLIQSASLYVSQSMVSGSHDLQDFTRILKFYDNVIFKMVKDFLPARSSVSSGIIIRPHALERNKIKQVQPTTAHAIHTGSISISAITSSHAGAYDFSDPALGDTNYLTEVMTPDGIAYKDDHAHQEAKFDGELSGSKIVITTADLPPINPFKYTDPNSVRYKVNTFEISACSIIFDTPLYDTCIPPTPTPTATPTPTVPGAPTVTPTPTPTQTIFSEIQLNVIGTPENGDFPAYQIYYSIDGFDTGYFTVEPTSLATAFANRKLRRNTDAITGNGSVSIIKISPTTLPVDEASILGSCSSGNALVSPSSALIFNRNFNQDVIGLFSISNLELGDKLLFEVEDTI